MAATNFTSDVAKATSGNIEVIVEATGNPAAGISHARAAIAAGKHIVMVNVEADVLAGRFWRRKRAAPAWSIRWPMATSRP
jgi:Predicted homoserine dehydrogenase